MTYEYFEDGTPAAANCSSKLHADVYEPTASDRVRLLSESQTIAALGSEDKAVRRAAEQRLQRSHVKFQPSDLIDRASERPDDAEDCVKGLSGFYGLSQTMAWAAVSLGNGEWSTRERATTHLKESGQSGFKAVQFALESSDAEVRSRAEEIRNHYYHNLPAEELCQNPMFLACLPKSPIAARFHGQCSTADLKLLEKETKLLMAFPDHQAKTVEALRQRLDSEGTHDQDVVRELRARTNLNQHLQRIDIAIANDLESPRDKFQYLMKALEAYPKSKNDGWFCYDLKTNKMLEDPNYRRAFARAGVLEAAEPSTP